MSWINGTAKKGFQSAGAGAYQNASVDSASPMGPAGGDLTGTYPNPTLAAIGGGIIGPIGDSTHTPVVTRDAKGRITALTSVLITGTTPGGAAGGALAGTYPNPTLAAVAGNPFVAVGSGSAVPVITTNAAGQITAITTTPVSAAALPCFSYWLNTTTNLGNNIPIPWDTAVITDTAGVMAAGLWTCLIPGTYKITVNVLVDGDAGAGSLGLATPVLFYVPAIGLPVQLAYSQCGTNFSLVPVENDRPMTATIDITYPLLLGDYLAVISPTGFHQAYGYSGGPQGAKCTFNGVRIA